MRRFTTVCVALFLFLSCSAAPVTSDQQVPPQSETSPPQPSVLLPKQLEVTAPVINEKLSLWVRMWKEIKPDFSIASFTKISEQRIVPEETARGEFPADEIKDFMRVYSPDRTKFVDAHASVGLTLENGVLTPMFEPDSSVELTDLQNKTVRRLLFCGTPCGFDDAVWIDSETFAVVGHTEYYPPSGEVRCTVDTTCTYVATLHVFDLRQGKVSLYYGPESETQPDNYLYSRYPELKAL